MNCDIIYSIFQYLDPFDIIICSLVCKLFNKVSHSEQLWKPLFKNTFYDVILTNDTYYNNYKKYNKLNNFIGKTLISLHYYPNEPYLNVNDIFNVECITFEGQKICHIPQEIGLLVNIRTLQLIGLPLQTFPDIFQLINLKELEINNNLIKIIPSEIKQLINLEYLVMCDTKLQMIPNEICQMTKLSRLCFSKGYIDYIPPELGQLVNLTYLDLGINKIDYIPCTFGQLTKLQCLYLFDNKLKVIPSELEQLTKLIYISIYGNELESINVDFKKIKNCYALLIDNTQKHLLPEHVNFAVCIRSGY